MAEFSKDEIIQFFRSVVKPVLEDCEARLRNRGWETSLQVHNDPADPVSWVGNRLESFIHASKADGGQALRYTMWAERFGNTYYVYHDLGLYTPKRVRNLSDLYPSITAGVTKDNLLIEIGAAYNNVKSME